MGGMNGALIAASAAAAFGAGYLLRCEMERRRSARGASFESRIRSASDPGTSWTWSRLRRVIDYAAEQGDTEAWNLTVTYRLGDGMSMSYGIDAGDEVPERGIPVDFEVNGVRGHAYYDPAPDDLSGLGGTG